MPPMTLNDLNFSGGPGVLPARVLRQASESILELPDLKMSVLGVSHRSDWFSAVVAELENNVRELLGLPDAFHVLALQGGATQQFSMIPMSLLSGQSQAADYLHTGYWSGKAIPEARRHGAVRTVWSGEAEAFRRLPTDEELSFSSKAPYLHYVSNETVEGLQFHRRLGFDAVPRICDMSSDFLSAPGDYSQFSMIYAHAQKNIGPAGVTLVVLHDDFLARMRRDLPGFLNYHTQVDAHSIYNTPPVFAIYVVLLVTRWLKDEIGGLEKMAGINRQKAALLYRCLDDSGGFYRARARLADRSLMNVAFNLADPVSEAAFLKAAQAEGFSGLAGHRSLGGIRASLYNGMSVAAVECLIDFMNDFRCRPAVSASQGR